MMASYFQRVLEAKGLVDTSIGSHSQVLLNWGQCEWLGVRLQEAVQCARDAFPAPSTMKHFDQLLKDFYLKVKDVEVLVGQCCMKPWLSNALLFGDIEESFLLKGLELHWFQTLFKLVKQGSETGLWLEGVSKWAMLELEKTDDIEVMVQDLEDKAIVDRAGLRRNLEESIRLRSSTSVTHTSLSDYLLTKLDLKSSQSSELGQTAPHDMWAVDPNELSLRKSIGGGTSGKVYQTKWLKQHFARKVFNLCDKTVFEKEVACLAALQHPHILPMFCCSVDSHKQTCSLVMELMPEDLHSFMARRRHGAHDAPFSLHVTVDLMLQIAEGMQFLYKTRMVHRDLKSSNILVRPVKDTRLAAEGFVLAKLADFGLSKTKVESASHSPLTGNVGTLKWMAPELLGSKDSDHKSYSIAVDKLNNLFKVDVYSYAITCYEVLTGRDPYHDVSLHAEIRMKVKDEYLRPKLPATCPISLGTLIVKCWDEEPCRRPSFENIVKELRHIKGQLLMGEPSYALEPMSELYKTIAGERPFIPSACPKPLATFMERFRKLDLRPSNQSICNELRHMQGLLITEDNIVRQGGSSPGLGGFASSSGHVAAQGREEDCFQLTTLFINREEITKWCIDGNTNAIRTRGPLNKERFNYGVTVYFECY